MGIEPLAPVLPPGALVLPGVLAPVCGGIEGAAVLGRPVTALALGWGVDHARYVARVGQGEAGGAVCEPGDLPRRGPGDDVVSLGADGVDVALDPGEVYGAALYLYLSWLYEVVLEVGIAQVEAVGVACHARPVRVPVKEVEGRRLLPEEVIVDDVGPDQVVGAEQVEHVGHLAVVEIAALEHLLLHELYLRLVYEDLRVPHLREVVQRYHEGWRAEGVLVLACGEPGERDREQRSSHTVAHGID